MTGKVHKADTISDAKIVPISRQQTGALALVEQRTFEHNTRHTDAFIATLHLYVCIFEHPDPFLAEGVERMRDTLANQFSAGEGTISVLRRSALESSVISDEIVTISDHIEKSTRTYTIMDGQVTKVRLIEPTTWRCDRIKY